MSTLASVFFDGQGPFGLSPDFILNLATEAGGAVLTAVFTAGLVQVANEWRRDVQRDRRRDELKAGLARDTQTISKLARIMAKYSPTEIEAFARGELTILPPTKEAPAASNSVQIMVFLSQSAISLSENLSEYASIIRIQKRRLVDWLYPKYRKELLGAHLNNIEGRIAGQCFSFINELNELEKDRVNVLRAKFRDALTVKNSPVEDEETPEHYKNDVDDVKIYSDELISAIWRYNKTRDCLVELNDELSKNTLRDNFLEGTEFPEIEIGGKVPRQSFSVEINGEDFFRDFFRRLR